MSLYTLSLALSSFKLPMVFCTFTTRVSYIGAKNTVNHLNQNITIKQRSQGNISRRMLNHCGVSLREVLVQSLHAYTISHLNGQTLPSCIHYKNQCSTI